MAEETAKKEKKVTKAEIYIDKDQLNPQDTEVLFQLDGETTAVRRGDFVTVPMWIAKRAKEIGLISNYKEIKD
jgi:hypothetical protein